jgi:hypothetical protein
MVANMAEIERRLWAVADDLRANSGLKASEYSTPVLGLVFMVGGASRWGGGADAGGGETGNAAGGLTEDADGDGAGASDDPKDAGGAVATGVLAGGDAADDECGVSACT